VNDELIDQNLGRRPRTFIGAHHASPMILPPVPEASSKRARPANCGVDPNPTGNRPKAAN
jgi:hypothetical protein